MYSNMAGVSSPMLLVAHGFPFSVLVNKATVNNFVQIIIPDYCLRVGWLRPGGECFPEARPVPGEVWAQERKPWLSTA